MQLSMPWLDLAIAVPALAALIVPWMKSEHGRWSISTLAACLSLILSLVAWAEFGRLHVFEAHEQWSWLETWGENVVVIDEFNAPLIPLTALLFLLVIGVTPMSKRKRFPWSVTLLSGSATLMLFSCGDSRWVISLLALQTLLPILDLIQRRQPTGIFIAHQVLSLTLIVCGWSLLPSVDQPEVNSSVVGLVLLTVGLLVRCGVSPLHGWQIDLVERASFGTTILYLVPLTGVYGMVRLVLPTAPDWITQWIAIMSLITAVYAAGMALVQNSPRKLFVYLLISNSSLLLVGLETVTPLGLTGSLSLWMSQGFSLAAFGMTLRAIEGRVGRVSLSHFQGLYEQMPLLGGFFLLAGLASIGFPGTVGFVAYELLIEAVIDVYSYSGVVVVCVMALNGIAVMRSYFRLFTGHAAVATISMQPRWYERIAIIVFSVFILLGGFVPQPGIATRYHAAQEMIQRRRPLTTLPTASSNQNNVQDNQVNESDEKEIHEY